MSAPLSSFVDILRRNRAGNPVGIYSVCSSHPYAIRAALHEAAEGESFPLIESTSNQVNQLGGYTGMQPADFRSLVAGIADEIGYPRERILFGGDHLGPFPWRDRPAAEALSLAAEMVRAYVAAGYEKIHLDVSMHLGDDVRIPGRPLSSEVVAERTAALCAVAEEAARRRAEGRDSPVYVIGNEVPVPGGSQDEQGELRPTDPADLVESLGAMQAAFRKRGLMEAWKRVVAVVVQPGVEFGDRYVHDYHPVPAAGLVAHIEKLPGLVYEAHSTDFQHPDNLKQLVADHFAVLKVGPALTFAFREAVQALEAVEELLMAGEPAGMRSRVTETLVAAMKRDDRFWKGYYRGSPEEIELDLLFSLSDRIRYYWTTPEAKAAFNRLLANLRSREIPLSLLSQYLPIEYRRVRSGLLAPRPEELIVSHIGEVIRAYSRACT